jgi:hypothetical protein
MPRNRKPKKPTSAASNKPASIPSSSPQPQKAVDRNKTDLLVKYWNEADGTFDIDAMKAQLQEEAETIAMAITEDAFRKKNREIVDELAKRESALSETENKIQELQEKHSSLESEIAKIEAAIATKEDEIIEATASEAESIVSDASKNASDIIDKSKKEALRAKRATVLKLEKKELEVNERISELDAREEKLRTDRMEVDRQRKTNEMIREVLKEKAEKYSDASPERVSELEFTIAKNNQYIDSLQKKYVELEAQLKHIRLMEMQAGDKTAVELFRENSELQAFIEDLRNKVNRYSEYQLHEMERAIKEEPALIDERDRLLREVTGYRNELVRYENAQFELESVKAQIELVKSLNDQLKEELLAMKSTFEAQTGEICPNLTRIDKEEREHDHSPLITARKKTSPLSLPRIITHIQAYAASQDVPLYYTKEDISAFVAGLASSKLSILQGLSGTGKTSLPRIFAQAIGGENKMVSVESSWRDRSELLGYYNDFNKKFTAKDFTCHLYRACHAYYTDIPYFIVLDEMNLSRVEYYFADFLSVLEYPDKKDWMVSLVDVSLERLPRNMAPVALGELKKTASEEVRQIFERIYSFNGKMNEDMIDSVERDRVLEYIKSKVTQHTKYVDCIDGPQRLVNGNLLRIPENVWFIGTANRDESTFEITDKVYDRAQVLNFTKKAKAFPLTSSPGSVAISYSTLKQLFEKAEYDLEFDYSQDPVVTDIDDFLSSMFKISFGNRIGNQINTFVNVYVAARQSDGIADNKLIAEAIDYQIANKVLRKLEHVDITKIDNFKKLREQCVQKNLKQCERILNERIESEG